MEKRLKLKISSCKYSIIQLAKDSKIPEWININDNLFSITRTSEELSIVYKSSSIPKNKNIEQNRNWIIIKIEEILDLSLVGILYSISKVLKQYNIPMFTISTYNTDYILIKKNDKRKAIKCLSKYYDII